MEKTTRTTTFSGSDFELQAAIMEAREEYENWATQDIPHSTHVTHQVVVLPSELKYDPTFYHYYIITVFF